MRSLQLFENPAFEAFAPEDSSEDLPTEGDQDLASPNPGVTPRVDRKLQVVRWCDEFEEES